MKKQHMIIIPDEGTEERIDQALARLLPEYSRTQIKGWIEDQAVLMNGLPVKAKTRVSGGESIAINATLKAQPAFEAEAIPLNIHYEDDAFIIINKPVGLVVHPGAGNKDHTLLNALLHHAPSLSELPRAGILHRLDKDTSGLLIIAKTADALKSLNHQLKKRTIQREYKAIVSGKMISGGTINAPIDRHPLQRTKMAVVDTGKQAVTHYRIGEKFRNHTLLQVKLETGRTHQIRVHLTHIRHPIIGDRIYHKRIQLSKGMSEDLIQCLRDFKRQALHAYAVQFEHPVTHDTVRFQIDLPDDMEQLLALLKKDMRENNA